MMGFTDILFGHDIAHGTQKHSLVGSVPVSNGEINKIQIICDIIAYYATSGPFDARTRML